MQQNKYFKGLNKVGSGEGFSLLVDGSQVDQGNRGVQVSSVRSSCGVRSEAFSPVSDSSVVGSSLSSGLSATSKKSPSLRSRSDSLLLKSAFFGGRSDSKSSLVSSLENVMSSLISDIRGNEVSNYKTSDFSGKKIADYSSISYMNKYCLYVLVCLYEDHFKSLNNLDSKFLKVIMDKCILDVFKSKLRVANTKKFQRFDRFQFASTDKVDKIRELIRVESQYGVFEECLNKEDFYESFLCLDARSKVCTFSLRINSFYSFYHRGLDASNKHIVSNNSVVKQLLRTFCNKYCHIYHDDGSESSNIFILYDLSKFSAGGWDVNFKIFYTPVLSVVDLKGHFTNCLGEFIFEGIHLSGSFLDSSYDSYGRHNERNKLFYFNSFIIENTSPFTLDVESLEKAIKTLGYCFADESDIKVVNSFIQKYLDKLKVDVGPVSFEYSSPSSSGCFPFFCI